ncbi:MAG: sulfurtransferase TusA family protein, partial [Patescibacteria group bacterium]
GLLAEKKDGQKGFKVFAGGGMGAEPLLGSLLEEFIPEDELGYCVAAIKSVFYKKGDRRNKHHNRMRFLIKDSGMDNFKQWYLQELNSIKESEYISLRKINQPRPKAFACEIPETDEKDFKEFIRYSLLEQKQDGLASIELRIPRGDIPAQKLEALAHLAEDFPGMEFRTSSNQNLCLCNVKKQDSYKLFLKLKQILKYFLYPATLQDIVCCKGALTCNLGLCNSPGLTEKLEEIIGDNFIGSIVLEKLNIKINGCPNGCGQHPIGLIALCAVVRRVGGRPVPFYKLLLGGRKGIPDTKLAEDTGLIMPAKSIPSFIKDFIERIRAAINADTDIHSYIDENGRALAKEAAAKYLYVPSYSENKDYYIDWGNLKEFSLEGLGPGECGAGVIDMIEADLTDAKIHLDSAVKNNYQPADIKKLLFFSSRALLVVRGSDPKDDLIALGDFIGKFINAGLANPKFSNLKEVYNSLADSLGLKEKEEKFLYAKEFYEQVKELYKNMEPSFNFPKYAQRQALGPEAEESRPDAVLDLKGVQCPMNYVRAKLYLENVKIGQLIELCLDEGEPIQNVPASLKNDGQEIVNIEKAGGYYKVLVKKLVDS